MHDEKRTTSPERSRRHATTGFSRSAQVNQPGGEVRRHRVRQQSKRRSLRHLARVFLRLPNRWLFNGLVFDIRLARRMDCELLLTAIDATIKQLDLALQYDNK